jgi:hypothetical protein
MIKSYWNGNTLITEAYDNFRTSPGTILRTHTSPAYSKLIDVEYTFFQIHGNYVECAFPMKIGPIKTNIRFEKFIERLPDKTLVHFQSNGGKTDISGTWLVKPTPNGSFLSLKQETKIPGFLKFLPIKTVVESKIKNVYEKLRVLP